MTPLMLSVCNTSAVDVTAFLLRSGALVDAAHDDLQQTALHYACKHSNIQAIRLLLRFGANINAVDCTNRTVLHWAALKCPAGLVTKLIRRCNGRLVNSADDSGYTPLMVASEHGRLAVVHALLDARADPRVRNKLNHNAVELADWFGFRLVVELLDQEMKPGGRDSATSALTGAPGDVAGASASPVAPSVGVA
jgi:ankyrin repeat protein